MLTPENKTSTLWKNYKGWGSTHPERETFEELYKAYNQIASNSVLTYGHLLPRKKGDFLYEEVMSLDSTNEEVSYEESSFKKVPLVKKHTNLKLSKISNNCNHAFAILDEEGNQIKNIIPYDYSDEGLYNIILRTQDGEEILWGSCDWIVDTNSSLLTFNNGVPSGVSASKPPLLTFYQYVGPVGERHYIDAVLFDIPDVPFEERKPISDFTDSIKEFLDKVEPGFFETYKFSGSDVSPGVGLQFEVLSNVMETETNDPVKGYDDNSNSQIVSLISHKQGFIADESTFSKICFASEGLKNKTYSISVESVNDEGYAKVDLDEGFVVFKGIPGNYTFEVSEGDRANAVLLVKDNKTQDYELFYPREKLKLTLKLPTFVDLIKLPPHLKLTTLNSYSDHITPQYYGPRVVDFVIASDPETVSSRSADFVIYNKPKFYLEDAFASADKEVKHFYFRNGLYKNYPERALSFETDISISGETKENAVWQDISEIDFTSKTFIENITFKNCKIVVKGSSFFKNCNFENTVVEVSETSESCFFKNCSITDLENKGKSSQIFDSSLLTLNNLGTLSVYSSSVIDTCNNTGNIDFYSSFVQTFENGQGLFQINSSKVNTLDIKDADKNSTLNTTNIQFVESLPDFIKVNTSYVMKFSDKVTRKVYPDNKTVPYYDTFNRRVYAKLPAPFKYVEEENEITLALDSIKHTLFINGKGELQCRTLSGSEILVATPDQIKTQIEDHYKEHADTVLETDKPQTLDEAILDLYWSKADLKNGKLPIDQLPDSVAYGGLEFVGMWSFENNEGRYPTFEDITEKDYISDDSYTELQKGWFFIVESSNKEDDPTYPQIAVLQDGETEPLEFTAGDWVIYSGKNKEGNPIFEKLDRAYRDPVYSRLPEKAVNSNGENLPWSLIDGGTGLLQLSYKSLAEALRLINEELLKLSPDRPASIQDIEVVLDERNTTATKRQYFEVFNNSSLLAVKQRKVQECWDGTEGDTILCFKQKGIHDELPLEHTFYCGEDSDIEVLDRFEGSNDSSSFDSTDSNDSLETEVGNSTSVKDITSSCDIDIFDPYDRYKLGFKAPTILKAAEVKGYVAMGQGSYKKSHEIFIRQSNMKKHPLVEDEISMLEGSSQPLTFLERKFYLDSPRIKACDKVNTQSLDSTFKKYKIGGVGHLPCKEPIVGSFTIENFTKYGTIGTDAEVKIRLFFSNEYHEDNIEIKSQVFILRDPIEESYDLEVSFETQVPDIEVCEHSDFRIEAQVVNFGKVSSWTTILSIEGLLVVNPENIPHNLVESGGKLLNPTFNLDKNNQNEGIDFGMQYKPKPLNTQLNELIYTDKGFCWPDRNLKYLKSLEYIPVPKENYLSIDNIDNLGLSDGSSLKYCFSTFSFKPENMIDLCGFNVNIEWGNDTLPEMNPLTGLYENVTLQIYAESLKNKENKMMNGNLPVPVFYETSFQINEACCYAGKSTLFSRRITFGRKPIPVQGIYVRVGVPDNSGLAIKSIHLDTEV